ncbi:MAG TPA: YCF48-related protein [Bryobacteraceae bacterium]|nr:YCF48-related protein [Bryobacteraceae bacterium]
MRFLIACLALIAPMAHGEKWKIQYFYDQLKENFYIEDLEFPSAERGVAVGSIVSEGAAGKVKYVSMVTSDGGEHWATVPLKEHPRSLFFLNDSAGWMVTDDSIWFTDEAGRSWKKIGPQAKPDKKVGPAPPGGLITRVWFKDRENGFAIGLQKTVLETHDGGAKWTPVAEAAKPAAAAAHTVYSQIWMDGKNGIIVGGSQPPRPDDPHLPAWMEPERAVKRRQVPTLAIVLQTLDGGATWSSSTAPLFGTVASVRLAENQGMAVFEFNDSFEWPSEVYRIDTKTGVSASVFHAADRRVTDGALFSGPRGFLAAVEPPGKLTSVPIPGKVRMLTSTDFTNWSEMDVDYKAVARSVVLAGPDADHQWAATDTGMILHLVP